MQQVSAEYKKAMKQAARNKSYMQISLKLVNQEAQNTAEVEQGGFTYFTDTVKPLSAETVDKVYATFERRFAKVDGSMYFLPRKAPGAVFYNAGIVTEALCEKGSKPGSAFIFIRRILWI